MAKVIFIFTEPIIRDGHAYTAQVCGREAGHVWEGWIEFEGPNFEVLQQLARRPSRTATHLSTGPAASR